MNTDTHRAPMNMPTELDAVWMMVAMHITTAPNSTAVRRPSPSDMYGENGYAARQPMFCRVSHQSKFVSPSRCLYVDV